MAQPTYNQYVPKNPNEQQKKREYIKLGTFYVKKKTLLILAIVVGVIAIINIYNNSMEKKEVAARKLAEAQRLAAAQGNQEDGFELSYAQQLQLKLREQYGDPPEGFEWDILGNLIPLSTDDLSYEDIVYTYCRACSVLDFSTAQKVASDSSIIERMNSYYSDISKDLTDYENNFYRKQFRYALNSMEIVSLDDIAIFADGDIIATVTVNVLDLTDKDFWLPDKEEIFSYMWTYDKTETDSVKKNQYVYEYILSKYADNSIPKRKHVIDLKISKGNGSGWLVSNDKELCDLLTYELGLDVKRYICDEYEQWAMKKSLEESLAQTYKTTGEYTDLEDTSFEVDANSTAEEVKKTKPVNTESEEGGYYDGLNYVTDNHKSALEKAKEQQTGQSTTDGNQKKVTKDGKTVIVVAGEDIPKDSEIINEAAPGDNETSSNGQYVDLD